MWSEHTGQKTAQAYFNRYYAKKADSWVFNPPPANPGGPADMFDGSVYERGAMTLQALRVKLGDGTFFPMLRAWYAAHTYGNVTGPRVHRVRLVVRRSRPVRLLPDLAVRRGEADHLVSPAA